MPSGWSVLKCNGESQVPTDSTHGAEEPMIFPICSTQMVIDFFFLVIWNFIYSLGLSEVRPNDRQVPSEENVTFLTSMGFSRDRVVRALQTMGNNVEAATNLLLQE